jgi:hypothetical protein
MNDAAVKTAVDRFVREFSFAAQREIEKCVRKALADGTIKEDDQFTAGVTLSSPALDLDVTIYRKIAL